MKESVKRANLYLTTILLITMASCQGEDIIISTDNQDENRVVSFTGPAAKFNYSLGDLITDLDEAYIRTDATGAIYLTFKQEHQIQWGSLVRFNNVTGSWIFPVTAVPPGNQAILTGSGMIRLNPGDDVRYDQIILNNGSLVIEIQVPPGSTGSVIVSIPEALLNQNRLTSTVAVNPLQTRYVVNFNLAGAAITPRQNSPVIPFYSYISVETLTSLSGFTGPGNVAVSYTVSGLTHERAYGYFGQQESSRIDASLDFDVLDEFAIAENIEFGHIELDIEAINSMGVSFQARAENTRFFKTMDNPLPVWQLTLNAANQALLNIPAAIDGQPVIPSTGNIKITPSNSNILEIGNNFPVRLLTNLYALSNPQGLGGPQNFTGRNPALPVNIIFTVPLLFRASGYSRTDTIGFDFRQILEGWHDEARKISRFEVYMDFSSMAPFDLQAKAWVIDSLGNRIDDIIAEETFFIRAARPATGNNAATAQETSTSVKLTGEQINLFLNAGVKHIVIESSISTYNSGNVMVTLRDNMSVDGKVSFAIEGQIPIFN